MIIKVNVVNNKMTYGLYDTSNPYPKNSIIKKSVNKRLLHITNKIQEKTNMNIECAVCSIFNK